MDTEILNPFILGAFSVLEMVLATEPEKGELTNQSGHAASQEVNIVCGVTGQVRGQVILGMSEATGRGIAEAMFGQAFDVFDDLAESAISELCNMICGNALLQMSEAGYLCDITPPAVIRGAQVKIGTGQIPGVLIPLTVLQGDISITLVLEHPSSQVALAAAG